MTVEAPDADAADALAAPAVEYARQMALLTFWAVAMSAVEQNSYMPRAAALEMPVGLLHSQAELKFAWNGGMVGWT